MIFIYKVSAISMTIRLGPNYIRLIMNFKIMYIKIYFILQCYKYKH